MKHIPTMALMLNLAIVSAYAQPIPVNMPFSGTAAASAINLQYQGTGTGEENVAGNGSLGPFTFRNVTASAVWLTTGSPSSQPPSTCSGSTLLFFPRVAGAGIFRFQDGSLLNVTLTQGGDCVDLVALEGHCTLTLQVTGGTGRFKNASGVLTYTETAVPVLGDSFGNPVFFEETGEVTGTVSRVASGEEHQDERR